MMMLRMALAAVLICGMGLVSPAAALTLLGTYTPPEPASLADEVGYINTVLAQPSPSGPTVVGTLTVTRTANDCGGSTCVDAVLAGAVKSADDPSGTGIDVSGFTYLIGKYDGPNGGGLVWFVGGDTTVNIPQNFFGKDNSQYGLSHFSLFNPGTTTVPEPGTLLLVGTGLVAVGLWRRRR